MRLAASWRFAGHAELLGDRAEALFELAFVRTFLGNEGDAHEELAGVEIVELGRVDDVAALLGEVTRDRSDDAAGRLAGYGQHIVLH